MPTTPPVRSLGTINETSFAVGYTDAQCLLLDGLAKTGGARKDLFARAERALDRAESYAHTEAELTLVRGLIDTVHTMKSRGMNV